MKINFNTTGKIQPRVSSGDILILEETLTHKRCTRLVIMNGEDGCLAIDLEKGKIVNTMSKISGMINFYKNSTNWKLIGVAKNPEINIRDIETL